MNNDLETILDVCLYQIEASESSVEECLAQYPEHAEELRPLLMAANKLSRVRDVIPDPSFKLRARSQLNSYMLQNPQRKRVSPVFWRFAVGFATVMMFFLAGGTAFAQQAVPGDGLYTWKLTSEHVWRYTYTDQLGYDIALSNRRMHELLEVSGDQVRREAAVRNYEELLVKLRDADAKDRDRILHALRLQHEVLLEAGVMIPELEPYFPR